MVMSEVSMNCADIAYDKQIDTCGTRCPVPLLRAKQALKGMAPGDVLKVLASDPAARADFDAMLKHLPHELLAYTMRDNVSGEYPRIDTFLILKGATLND